MPFHTGAADRPDTYLMRSSLIPGCVFCASVAGPDEPEGYRTPWDQYPVEWLRDRACEQESVRKYAFGDFYPLTSYSLTDDAWAAWQWNRPDLGEGAFIALRRPASPHPRLEIRLGGIDAKATYEVRSFDDGGTARVAGADLAGGKFGIEITERPGSRLYTYRRIG